MQLICETCHGAHCRQSLPGPPIFSLNATFTNDRRGHLRAHHSSHCLPADCAGCSNCSWMPPIHSIVDDVRVTQLRLLLFIRGLWSGRSVCVCVCMCVKCVWVPAESRRVMEPSGTGAVSCLPQELGTKPKSSSHLSRPLNFVSRNFV